jgi:hypothetical protein
MLNDRLVRGKGSGGAPEGPGTASLPDRGLVSCLSSDLSVGPTVAVGVQG